MPHSHQTFVLIILDGWGYREDSQHNAIYAAHKPYWDSIWDQYAHTLISGSGEAVGLPDGQMGNSEVGHLNIGAGRLVYQDCTRIEKAIEHGEFFKNAVFLEAIHKAITNKKAIHFLGLLSRGGVHSHERHLHAAIELAVQEGAEKIYVHAFLDGRDTPPQSAEASLNALESKFKQLGFGQIASIIGRYYAMDRDNRWDRVQQAYDLLTSGSANYHVETAVLGLNLAYQRGETDEFVKATAIHPKTEAPVAIEDGDIVIFMNYRADRARELTHAFIDQDFKNFARLKNPNLAQFVTLTQYATNLKTAIAFPPLTVKNGLGEYLSGLGLRQLHLAETEKYAHVTFFFNGGIEKPFPHEERHLISSPKVATYDQQPEMSAVLLTDYLVAAIDSQKYDFIVCNYANPDMVGHTGNFNATVKAIEIIDACLERVIHALQKIGGEAIITADHGNAECMFDEMTQQAHTAHTCDPVPFIYVGRPATIIESSGTLSDIAPTLLYLMGIKRPPEMTGKVLLQCDSV